MHKFYELMTAKLLYYRRPRNVYTKRIFSLLKISTKTTEVVELLVRNSFYI
jgi:hypothetical protein